MNKSKEYIFVDYEGTLSETPKGNGKNQEVLISDLLFGDVFSELQPNNKVKKWLLEQHTKNIFVLGIVDTNIEINQKVKWLKRHYNFIDKKNYIFVSGEHKKVEIINEFVKSRNIDKKDVIFVDDKQRHLNPAIQEAYRCINAADIL